MPLLSLTKHNSGVNMSSDRPNSPPLPGTSIPTLCRYCGETYSKLNVDHFSLIECPHCQCPDYQGKASRLQRALVDEKYKVFLAEKGEPDRSRMGSDVSHNRGETQTEAVSRNVINGVRQKISQERLGEKSPATPRAAEHTPYGRLYPALFQDVLAQIGKLNQEIQGLKDQNQSLSPDSPEDDIKTSSNQAILTRINQLEDQVRRLKTENQELKQALQKAHDDHMILKNQVRQSLKGLYQITTTRLVNLEQKIAELEGNSQSRNQPLKQTSLTDKIAAEMTDQIVNVDQHMPLHTPSRLDDIINPSNLDSIPDLFAVEMTEQSVINCLNNQHNRILFERKRTGRYWIHPIQEIPGENPIYHLGLKPDECLTQDRLLFVKSCFHVAHEERDGPNFRMIRPAIVQPVNYGDAWELSERGQIERLPSQDTNHA
jgi:hypothetical protein